MKRSTGNRWADHYTRKARQDKYPARSVYKLEEIQKRFRPLRKGGRVLDLGCAPGSWLLFAARAVGPGGRVTGVDLKPVTVRLPANVRVLAGDLLEADGPARRELAAAGHCDAVLSDMAPATTGDRRTDAARSYYLCEAALEIAAELLAPGGNFVCKIFQGEDFQQFTETVRKRFRTRRIYKPKSSRSASRETYVVGLGFERR